MIIKRVKIFNQNFLELILGKYTHCDVKYIYKHLKKLLYIV